MNLQKKFDIKPGGEEQQQIDYVKQTQIESTMATTIQKVLYIFFQNQQKQQLHLRHLPHLAS